MRQPCCEKERINKGAWSKQEDQKLIDYIKAHGEGCWRSLPKAAGLHRCGKSCRLRWINYLRPDIKRGNFAQDEEDLIIKLHALLGNRWSLIAGRLPGRTDNEVKNYWNSHIRKKLIQMGIDPNNHKPHQHLLLSSTTNINHVPRPRPPRSPHASHITHSSSSTEEESKPFSNCIVSNKSDPEPPSRGGRDISDHAAVTSCVDEHDHEAETSPVPLATAHCLNLDLSIAVPVLQIGRRPLVKWEEEEEGKMGSEDGNNMDGNSFYSFDSSSKVVVNAGSEVEAGQTSPTLLLFR